MNRRQLLKKIAGIAGAVVAAPVMAKEVVERTSGTSLNFSSMGSLKISGSANIKAENFLDIQSTEDGIREMEDKLRPRRFLIERKKFVEFPSNPAQGEMFYGSDGNLWIFEEKWWKVIGQYDILDGQHGYYYTSTH